MALSSSGKLSFGKSGNTLSINYVIGYNTSVVLANTNNAGSLNNGDVIYVSGAVGTEKAKLNGYWMVSNTQAGNIYFSIYTSDIANSPNNNILSPATYNNTDIGTWINTKKSSINIEIGNKNNNQINLNNTTIRLLANVVTPSSIITFSNLYSKYLPAAYIYSGNGDEVTQRYFFSTDAVGPMGSTTGNPFEYLSGTGNYTTSIFGGGYYGPIGYNNQTRLYTYSTDIRTVSSNSPTMNVARGYACSTGNADKAIFAGGKNASFPNGLLNLNEYTYSTGSFSLKSTGFSNAIINGAAIGNTSTAIFTSFSSFTPTLTRVKYVYSTATITTPTSTYPGSSNIFYGADRASSTGPSYGLFVGGGGGGKTGDTEVFPHITKYIFSTESYATSSRSLSTAATNIGGSGNKEYGYFFNGHNSSVVPVLATRKYKYSDETFTTASTLVSIPYVMDATSSSPGGF